ncbi:unannotated protein [freshwater metagenome]|uniref:Unannotated protein n=1 Tax=freshwater metagenome TaxID=449393 RepID=A0A6J7KAG5_9ZZZZ
MVHLAHVTALNEQAHHGSGALTHQVVVHRAAQQQ